MASSGCKSQIAPSVTMMSAAPRPRSSARHAAALASSNGSRAVKATSAGRPRTAASEQRRPRASTSSTLAPATHPSKHGAAQSSVTGDLCHDGTRAHGSRKQTRDENKILCSLYGIERRLPSRCKSHLPFFRSYDDTVNTASSVQQIPIAAPKTLR
jgi:hypothetical protein